MRTIAIIPARFASTRFPGKPLAEIDGRPMIQMVYERVQSSKNIDTVYVATDDARIQQAVIAFGGEVVMTSSEHRSGTDRIAEAMQMIDGKYDLVINVQGDEPGIDPFDLDALIALFENEEVDIGTLVTPFQREADFQNPNRVKAVIAQNGQAMYFTRARAPFLQGEGAHLDHCFQHVGVYAYRNAVLGQLSSLAPSPLELRESLEQLRWLESGFSIYAARIENAPFGIDTPEDLQHFIRSGT